MINTRYHIFFGKISFYRFNYNMIIVSEKQTDFYMQQEFLKVFNTEYSTGTIKKYFVTKCPDGFYEDDTKIFIIENK